METSLKNRQWQPPTDVGRDELLKLSDDVLARPDIPLRQTEDIFRISALGLDWDMGVTIYEPEDESRIARGADGKKIGIFLLHGGSGDYKSMEPMAKTYAAKFGHKAVAMTFPGRLYFDDPNHDWPGDTINADGTRATVVDGETAWLHFKMRCQFTGQAGGTFHYFFDSNGYPWLRTWVNGGNAPWQFQYNSGTGPAPVWTTIVAGTPSNTATLQEYDIAVKINSGGNHQADFYIGKSLLLSVTFAQASFTNIKQAQIVSGAGVTAYSEIVMTRNLATVGAIVAVKRANAVGNVNAWTGAFGDVNEAIVNDATTLSTAAAGNDYLFNYADFALPANYTLKSVFSWMRAKNDGAAPTNIKSLCRSGGTTFASANNMVGINAGFSGIGMRYDNDPNTAAPWMLANLNLAEFGGRSAA